MPKPQRFLRFAWWNLHDFAHYDWKETSNPRWPQRRADYQAKRDRVLLAFSELFGNNYPDLLAVCEITRQAAADLHTRLPSGFELAIAPRGTHDDFQVAVYYRTEAGLNREHLLFPSAEEDVPQETRPMIPVHCTFPGHVIRFVACHWMGFDDENSTLYRERLADFLRGDVYEFLHPKADKGGSIRHVVVLGDLNEEPTSPLFETRLIGTCDRARSRMRHHWRDLAVRRTRLYNAAWKYLGEQTAHGHTDSTVAEVAGTFFSPKMRWRTYDHLLVTGELLGANPPFLDEANTQIMSTEAMRDAKGFPIPFSPANPQVGVSDHLPIVGRIVLPEVSQ